MVPVDDDEDDFIVQAVEDTGAATADAQQQASWSLKSLGGLVFASTSGKAPAAEVEPEPEPTLPAGFSATLNAEEEEIYPAAVRDHALSSITHTRLSPCTCHMPICIHRSPAKVAPSIQF